jgi:cell division protein FtsL
MANDEGFGTIVAAYFKKVSGKVKFVLGTIVAAIGLVFVVIFRSRMNKVKMLEYELKKIRHEIEIEKASEDIEGNEVRIAELTKKEDELRRMIFEIGTEETSGDVTPEKLDKFFDDRGF